MNGVERINAALSGKYADKIPVMLHNFMMAVPEAGITMEQYRNDPKKIAEVYVKAVEKYHYDAVIVDVDTVTLAGACGVPVDFPVNEPARSNTGILNSLDEVSSLPPVNISGYKYVNYWCEGVRLLKEYFKDDIYLRGNCDQAPFSLATMIRGVENLMIDLCIEPEEKIYRLLDYCAQATCQFITMMKEAGADMVSNGDSPAGPEMLSPDLYRKYALPYEKKICDHAHSLGLPYGLHICGNTDLIIDDMIESGSDLIELDYKTNILLAEEKMRSKTVFSGNIDPSGVLGLGSVALVREKTMELLEIFKDNPRFILNAGCAIPNMTPPENIFAMIQVARNYR